MLMLLMLILLLTLIRVDFLGVRFEMGGEGGKITHTQSKNR